jgi:drug/metabolite transporter (DMT)-like permease
MTVKFRGEIMLLSGSFIWGTAYVFQSIAMDFMLPLTFVWLRTLLASIILGLFVMIRSRFNPKYALHLLGSKKGYQGAFLAGLFIGMAMITQQIGIVDATVAKAGFFTSLYLLLVPIIYVLFGKKVTMLQWVAIAIGMLGVFYLSTEGQLDDGLTVSDGWILVCAFFYAFQIITIDFRGSLIDPIMFSFVQFATAFVVSLIPALWFEGFNPSFVNHPEALVALFYVGAISGVLGFTFQIIGQNLFKNPTVASLLMSFEAVFALIMGFILLGETLSWVEGFGAFLLFLAIMFTHLKWKPKSTVSTKS